MLGTENVLVAGDDAVDLAEATQSLAARGWRRVLCEGGPRLLRDLLAAELVDELCLTVVPTVVAGDHPRILAGAETVHDLEPRLLLEEDGTLLGRWAVR